VERGTRHPLNSGSVREEVIPGLDLEVVVEVEVEVEVKVEVEALPI